MKRLIIGMLAVLALTLCAVDAATTVDAKRLSTEEMANHLGANYMVEVEYSDFSTTATNTAEVLTWDIAAGQGFVLLYAEVVTEFVGAAGTDSLTVTVGNTDVDQYLTSMEMATESSEVSGLFGTGLVAGEFYDAADTIDFTFTPNAENATADFTAGKVRFWCHFVD